jgi:hypothetical protein
MASGDVTVTVRLPAKTAENLAEVCKLASVKPEIALRVILALALPKPAKEAA